MFLWRMGNDVGAMRRSKVVVPRTSTAALAVKDVGDRAKASSIDFAICFTVLTLSGTAALIYQVIWVKLLTLIVGVDVYAVAITISVFFAGLALGSLLIGRISDRLRKPLRLLGALEILVALTGVVVTTFLPYLEGPFSTMEANSPFLAWGVVIITIVSPPIIMGGAIPLMARHLGADTEKAGPIGGRIYAANTAGGIVGALITPFVLIPAVGVWGSALAAGVINAIAAALVFTVQASSSSIGAAQPKPMRLSADARTAVLIYALAGAIALGYEVLWSQTVVQFMSTRAFAFAIILATYLLGLAAGSASAAPWVGRLKTPWLALGLLIGAAGCIAIVEVALLGSWIAETQSLAENIALSITGNELVGICARFTVATFAIVLLPTFLLGAAFPVALRIATDGRLSGGNVGLLIGTNTLGGIAGTLVTGFILVPNLGLIHTTFGLAAAAVLLGIWAVAMGRAASTQPYWAMAAMGALIAVIGFFVPPQHLATLLAQSRRGVLVDFEESRVGAVAVIEQTMGQNKFRRLYIQGVSNSGDAMPSLRYMRLQALLPLIVHNGNPKSALVIGLGTGITAGALLRDSALERVVAAELLPSVVRLSSKFEGNYQASQNPKLSIHLRDGRRELQSRQDRYDVITLEPPPPSAASVVNLYSKEFYNLAASRLNNQGIVAQWLPIATQNEEDTRSLVQSFIKVFPHASLWTSEFHEMLLLGSMQEIHLDALRIGERYDQTEIRKALEDVGVTSSASLLATFVTDRAGLQRYAGRSEPVTDDRPLIEYATWVGRRELARALPTLLALQTEPILQNADNVFTATVGAERARLMTFYSAGLHAYNGEREQWARDISKVMRQDGANPYFNWFTGGLKSSTTRN